MAKDEIRVIRAIPGSASIGPLVTDFCRRGEGVITAFADSLLPILKDFAEDYPDIQIEPFGLLVFKTLILSGEDARPIASSQHRQAAIAQACRELDFDSPFFETAKFPGLHAALTKTIHQLDSWGLFWPHLREIAAQTSGRLSAKLTSLSKIAEESERLLKILGRETHGQHLSMALESVPQWEQDEMRLLVFADAEFSPMRLNWLKWAADHGANITIVLARHATDGEIFESSTSVADYLKENVVEIGEGNRLLRNLFSSTVHEGAGIEVEISSSADLLAECEWALRGCLEQSGTSGIYVRDLANYAPLLEAAAHRLQVPLRLHRRSPLLTNAFARLVLGFIEFCASRDVRSLLRLLPSSYLSLRTDEKLKLEDGIREAYRLKVLQWDELERWSAFHAEEFPWLKAIIDWRKEAKSKTESLVGWKEKMESLVAILKPFQMTLQEGYNIDRDIRATTTLSSSLASEASIQNAVHRSVSLTLEGFAIKCREVWSAVDVSLPTNDSGILVSSKSEALVDVDRLFVLGMLEGVFPKRRTEDPILTDSERAEISKLNSDAPELPNSHDEADAERDEFYRVCAAARSRIVLSYPLTDEGRDNIPAFYLEVVKQASPNVQKVDHPRPELTPTNPISIRDETLKVALNGPREYSLTNELIDETILRCASVDEQVRYTPDQLRTVIECPFLYTAKYRLAIQTETSRSSWTGLNRLPAKLGLAKIESSVDAENRLFASLESEIDGLYAELPEWELELLRAGGRRQLKEWMQREAVARDIWKKDPGETKTQVAFGEAGLKDRLPGGVGLTGSISAYSRLKGAPITHIYGGPNPKFDLLSEADRLFYGIHLLSSFELGKPVGIEVETFEGERCLVLLGRSGLFGIQQQVNKRLRIEDFGVGDEPSVAAKMFFEPIKKSLKKAVTRISQGVTETISGEHCERCRFGELCRRSQAFGESDSPFGVDEVMDVD